MQPPVALGAQRLFGFLQHEPLELHAHLSAVTGCVQALQHALQDLAWTDGQRAAIGGEVFTQHGPAALVPGQLAGGGGVEPQAYLAQRGMEVGKVHIGGVQVIGHVPAKHRAGNGATALQHVGQLLGAQVFAAADTVDIGDEKTAMAVRVSRLAQALGQGGGRGGESGRGVHGVGPAGKPGLVGQKGIRHCASASTAREAAATPRA